MTAPLPTEDALLTELQGKAELAERGARSKTPETIDAMALSQGRSDSAGRSTGKIAPSESLKLGSPKLTPVRRQYLALKSQQADAILLFRMGDFYECFDEDAAICARELGIALTSRPMGKDEGRVPLAGVPHHQLDRALERLVASGFRVAIAEQVSEPGQGLVERQIVRVVTPGTVESSALVPDVHSWLVALAPTQQQHDGPQQWALAACDVTTGELELQLIVSNELGGELSRLQPREVLLPETDSGAPIWEGFPTDVLLTHRTLNNFNVTGAREKLCEQFKVATLDGYELGGFEDAIGPAGALLSYLAETWPGALDNLRPPRVARGDEFVFLDSQTRRNLELFSPANDSSPETGIGQTGALITVLDETRTAMGARLLRTRIGRPLREPERIENRLDAVTAFVDAGGVRHELREALRGLPDIERLVGRVRSGTAHARHLVQLAGALGRLPVAVKTALKAGESVAALLDDISSGGEMLPKLTGPCSSVESMALAAEVAITVTSALNEDPPIDPADGDTVRTGFDHKVDRLRDLASGARGRLTELELAERERSGLNVKVGYHRVFGYYLELPKAQADRAPDDYEPRQTLTASQRFRFTPLTKLEDEILTAKEDLLAAERDVITRIREELAEVGPEILHAAGLIASLDVAATLAEIAVDRDYVRPELASAGELLIEDGRHPVVERELPSGEFVPNGTALDSGAEIVLLTGPNMGGKSTYLRQTALIVLLAQCGSFVPARRARVPVIDRIFSRVGAQDDLAAGQSTFMVEMVETATILHRATECSLVILDEVGRGTATDDGLAIAQAVVEYLHDRPDGTPLTLFATHYHELTTLSATLPRVMNRSVAVSEISDEVVFLYRIVDGGADRSYGVHVAGLAGLPPSVVSRARELLDHLETRSVRSRSLTESDQEIMGNEVAIKMSQTEPLLRAIADIELDSMTPLESLQELYELRSSARSQLGIEE